MIHGFQEFGPPKLIWRLRVESWSGIEESPNLTTASGRYVGVGLVAWPIWDSFQAIPAPTQIPSRRISSGEDKLRRSLLVQPIHITASIVILQPGRTWSCTSNKVGGLGVGTTCLILIKVAKRNKGEDPQMSMKWYASNGKWISNNHPRKTNPSKVRVLWLKHILQWTPGNSIPCKHMGQKKVH